MSAKIQRWVDLLAALLRRHGPATLDELVRDVPAYAATKSKPALRRTFERDKDELRSFGVPLLTVNDPDGEVAGYRLKREEFYLPYLTVLRDGRSGKPRRVDRYGYRALAELSFELDELDAIAEAARRVQQLGDPRLAELAVSAMRKLAFDLPVDAGAAPLQAVRAPARAFAVAARKLGDVLGVLDDALRRRKRVTVDYRSIGSGETARRELSPYGLFFLGHHWYLAATDEEGGPVKNFRVSRIQSPAVNTREPNSPDYDISADFSLREHARSRQAWELGDGTVLDAVVEFRGASGPTMAARRLGEPVAGAPDRRRFAVRRVDSFARWLLSFAGELTPVEPPELVAAYDELARATLRVYAEAS
jgi:proteasome accessory factor B